LLADAVLGSMLLRHQGRAAWVRFNRALAEGRIPHKEVFDGVLVIFGGALLLTPGFITDVFGLILLIPPTRAIVRGITSRIVRRRMLIGQTTWTVRGGPRPRRGGTAPPPPPGPGTPGPPPRPAPRARARPGHGRGASRSQTTSSAGRSRRRGVRGPTTSRGRDTRSAMRTSCRPAGSPSEVDERMLRN